MKNCSENMNVNISSFRINYVSCIKIDGIPILPPLLSEADRAEMRRYRALAIKIQNKLTRLKSSCLSDSSFVTDSDTIDDYSSSSIVSLFTDGSVEDSTTKFSEGCTDVLNMLEDKYNGDYIEQPSKDMPRDTVPSSHDCDESNNIRVDPSDITETENRGYKMGNEIKRIGGVTHMDMGGDDMKCEDQRQLERIGGVAQMELNKGVGEMERNKWAGQMERSRGVGQMERFGGVVCIEGSGGEGQIESIEGVGPIERNGSVDQSGDVIQIERSGDVKQMEGTGEEKSGDVEEMNATRDATEKSDNNLGQTEGNIDLNQTEIENFIGKQTEKNLDIILNQRQLSHTIDKNKKVFPDDILKLFACADNVDVSSDSDKNISKLDKRNSNSESNDGYSTANENLDDLKSPTKLIRSRSFILENPSPFLLAQIEQQKNLAKRKTWVHKPITFTDTKPYVKRCSSNDMTKMNSPNDKKFVSKRRFSADETKRQRGSASSVSTVPSRRKGWDLKNARAKWSSIENDLSTILDNSRDKNKFNSLPSSVTPSPTSKMFGNKPKTKSNDKTPRITPQISNFYTIQPKTNSSPKTTTRSKSGSRQKIDSKTLEVDNNGESTVGAPNFGTPCKSTQTKPVRIVKGFVTPPSKSTRINLFNSPRRPVTPPKNICYTRKIYTPPSNKEPSSSPPTDGSHDSCLNPSKGYAINESYPIASGTSYQLKESYPLPFNETHIPPPAESPPKTPYQSPPIELYPSPPKTPYQSPPIELYPSPPTEPLPPNETYQLLSNETPFQSPPSESYQSKDLIPSPPKEPYASPPKISYKSPRPVLKRKINYINKPPIFKPLSPCYFVSEKDKTPPQHEIPNVPKNVKTDMIFPEKESPSKPVEILFHVGNYNEESNSTFCTELKRNHPDESLSTSTKSDMKDLFSKMQHIQKIQLIELMRKQKEEQELFLRAFSEQQTFLLSKLSEACTQPVDAQCDTKNNNMYTELMNTSEKLLHECKQILDDNNEKTGILNGNCDSFYISDSSQTIFTSTFGSNDTLNDSEFTLHNEMSEQPTDVTKYLDNNNDLRVVTSRQFKRSISNDSLELAEHSKSSYYNGDKIVGKIEKNITVCIEPKNEEKFVKQYTTEQIKAVTIINAATRGYLVRRLFRSERVQNLIQTIKDTLLCAMELHHENVEKIQPADIELHRRLIQQVTAACTSFHDVFFMLSLKEQMAVIALDRQRKKDRLLKPALSKSPSLSSTTQKRIEKKLKRDNSTDYSSSSNRSSFSRSCHSAVTKKRVKSLEDSAQNKKSNITQESLRRSTGSAGSANKKPWR